jgi:hypothetical protein
MRSFWRFLPLTGLAPKSSPETRIGTSEDRLNFASFSVHLRLVPGQDETGTRKRCEAARKSSPPSSCPFAVVPARQRVMVAPFTQ